MNGRAVIVWDFCRQIIFTFPHICLSHLQTRLGVPSEACLSPLVNLYIVDYFHMPAVPKDLVEINPCFGDGGVSYY